jgi:hypothetical protein
MLGTDELRLGGEQLLLRNQDVQHRTRADQRFLLGAGERELRGLHRRSE